MAGVFWKGLAVVLFLAAMTGLRFVLKWSTAGFSEDLVTGILIGAGVVIGAYFLFNWIERKGWAD